MSTAQLNIRLSIAAVLVLAVVMFLYRDPEPSLPADPNELKYGYEPAGQCMSENDFNRRTKQVIANNPKQFAGTDTDVLAAAFMVMGSMRDLGTKACPDLANVYDRYNKARDAGSR